LRPLSEIETFYAEANLSIHTTSHIQAVLPTQVLEKALNHTAKRHPLLSCRITRKNNLFYFDPIEGLIVPLQIHENVDTRAKYYSITRDELNLPLEKERGLIRAVLLKNGSSKKNVLITTIHHAIGDGLCCIELHKEIAQTCADILENRFQPASPLPLMPPLEHLLPNSSRLYHDQSRIVIPPTSEPTIEFIQKKLNRTQLRSLLERCRANATTVHGALCAAHLLAIRELLYDTNHPIGLFCHSPINMRSRLTPPLDKEHMFCAASSYTGCYSVDCTTSIWSLGKKIGEDIRSFIETGDVFKKILQFRELKTQPKPPISFSLTNIGNIETPTSRDTLEINEMFFMPLYRVPILGASVGTFRDRLIITYPYLTPHYSSRLIHKIANLVISHLSE
jgi:NRPS condensation-like uncharacterized protein